MKKFKILALVMTCAILLSSIMIIPVSAAETDHTCKDVSGKKITLDGVMDQDEGWATTPFLKLDKSGTFSKTSTKTDVETPSELYVSADANYLYVFFRSYVTNLESGHFFYFMIGFGKANPTDPRSYAKTAGADKNITVSVNLYNACSTLDPSNKTYSSNDSAAKTPINKIYDYNGATQAKDSVADSYKFYYEGIQATAKTDSTNGGKDCRTAEMRIPLPASVKSARLENAFDAYIISYENNAGKDAGYLSSESTFDWNSADVAVTLPRTAHTAPVLVGFQSRINPADDSKYDVRFVSVVDNYDGFALATSKLGYLFNNGTKDSEAQYCTTVYETLKAGDSTIKATDFGGTYFFCFTITGMDPAETYNWTVKCFTQADAEDAVEYCKNPVTVEITYDSTEKKAVFTY